jgi:hypothetical protein
LGENKSKSTFLFAGEQSMALDEKVFQYVQRLPRSLQEELLNFIQYLLVKTEQQEKQEWGVLSLSSAMRDMEDEPALYSMADIKVRFV